MPSCPSSVRPSVRLKLFDLKRSISPKWPDVFFFFWHFMPIYCKNMDLLESSLRSFLKVKLEAIFPKIV